MPCIFLPPVYSSLNKVVKSNHFFKKNPVQNRLHHQGKIRQMTSGYRKFVGLHFYFFFTSIECTEACLELFLMSTICGSTGADPISPSLKLWWGQKVWLNCSQLPQLLWLPQSFQGEGCLEAVYHCLPLHRDYSLPCWSLVEVLTRADPG